MSALAAPKWEKNSYWFQPCDLAQLCAICRSVNMLAAHARVPSEYPELPNDTEGRK